MNIKQYQFQHIIKRTVLQWLAYNGRILLFIAFFPILSVFVSDDAPSFTISHTNVVTTLNSDRSLGLKQSFTYHGLLKHGPEIVIDPGDDGEISIKDVTIKRGDHVIKVNNYFKSYDRDDLADGFDDPDTAKRKLAKLPNTYGYYYDNNRIHVIVNDPLKAGQSYQVTVNAILPKKISKHGVLKYNILGSASATDLGSVNARVINHTNGLVKSYYLQNLSGVAKYGSGFRHVNLKLSNYNRDDHLDLRTNLSYRRPLLWTRLYHLFFLTGFCWVVLIAFTLILVKVVNNKNDAGRSMAMPDIIFSDLLSAIYLTTGSYDRNLFGGLLTKKELLKQVFDRDLYQYQQTELEHRILASYEHYADLQLVSSAFAADYLANLDDFKTQIEETHNKKTSSDLGFFSSIALVALCLLCGLGLFFFKIRSQFGAWIWCLMAGECLLFLYAFIAIVSNNSISMFWDAKQQDLHVQLLRLANGMSDVGEIQHLHLADAGLWIDLIAWAVGIGLNKQILNELKQRGYELGFLDSIEQVDIVLADVSTAAADFTSFSSDGSDGGSDGFSSSGGSSGGGDAGGGSVAGGW